MTALIVVDVQNDFVEGGALAVKGGQGIVPKINQLIDKYGKNGLVVFTQDWHPQDHSQFVIQGGRWPVHCVQGTAGAELVSELKLPNRDHFVIVHKGTERREDGYSGFEGRDENNQELWQILKSHDVHKVVICGIATDYCVRATALDARKAGFEVKLAKDAIAGVSKETSDSALQEMTEAGVESL